MNKHIFKVFIFCFFITTIISCKKQLEIAPRQSIDAGTALNSKDAIEASITAIYAGLKSARLYGRDLIAVSEALSDNGFATNKSGRLFGEAQNNQGATFTTTIWTSGYGNINQINLTLEALPKLVGVTSAESDRWQGQLYFLRALYYFEMMKAYAYIPGAVVTAQDRGGVPIITKGIQTAEFALTFLPSRPPIDDVYKQIVDDFTIANTKLLNTATGVATSLASKSAAQAMLARVNLYAKNYGEAKRWADSCITLAGSRLTTAAAYVAGWRTEHHPEALFQVRFATTAENIGVNESLQTSYSTLVTAGNTAVTGGFGDLVPSLTLLTELGIGLTGGMTTANFGLPASIATRSTDVRNLIFEPGTSGRGNAKVECTKFLGKSGVINLDNVPVIRIAEVYLIRAEAQATSGSSVLNITNALADLKTIKSRRYTDYTGSAQEITDNGAAQAALLDEILRQRRIELALEGQRFFDLKRLGKDLVKAPHYSTIAFTDTRILAPILQGDVDGNPNLKQNLGY
jgi:starch-binding outer membrane protein, SusD/RagB family